MQELSKDTFGLVTVAPENAKAFEQLLAQIYKRFPDDLSLQIELAKAYRSLFESTDDPKYLNLSYELALAAASADTGSPEERYQANQVLALAFLRLGKPQEALRYLKEAEKTVPDPEKYKLAYNFCIVLHELERDPEALGRCKESDELAQAARINFWQPSFISGLIYLEEGNLRPATDMFIKCSEVAHDAGETDRLLNYLKPLTKVRVLCSNSEFQERYVKFCQTMTIASQTTGPD